MTPLDVAIFEVAAGLFTVSCLVLVFFTVRFMRRLEDGLQKLLRWLAGRDHSTEPIEGDLRLGAFRFRVASGRPGQRSEQMSVHKDPSHSIDRSKRA